MKLDVRLGGPLAEAAGLARRAEAMGFDGVWTSETQHDAFLPLVLAAGHTTRLELGTSIAVAFGRSPLVTAHLAWDLAALSQGRFLLGLGTQVKGHIERRYGLAWDSPGPRLKDYIQALRAIWDCWQHGTPLNYQGQFYSHTLMTPFFNPGPIAFPRVPIHIAGVQAYMCRLAGERCDGFQVHPFHSAKYLQEIVLPNVEEGLKAGGRTRADISLASSVFIVTGASQREMDRAARSVKSQISFYASTRNYRVILECHGWGQVARDLTRKSLEGDWEAMASLITDEMLDAFAIVGTPAEIPAKVRLRYTGLLDRLSVYESF
ncbi:MAG TPA: TIGR03617 family F420-dependent LLM class oxidoreductase, partial [Candidatus Methylomirabilis sp.]|nr:TIGR03617 family F420-dependent LLM class oxidoreductase [Candidatus Methylomirabilis sp.]